MKLKSLLGPLRYGMRKGKKSNNQLAQIAAVLLLLFSHQYALAEISKENPILDPHALEIQSEVFAFASDGSLSSGIVRSTRDPLDYSSLLKESYLKSGFELSVYRCSNGIGDCRSQPRKFPSTEVSFGLLIEEGILNNQEYETISRVGTETLAATGFSVTPIRETLEADIILVVGGDHYLASKLAKVTRQSRRKILKQISAREFDGPLDMIFGGSLMDDAFCYVSEDKWATDSQIYIFADANGLNSCLPQAFFNAVGVGPTWLDIPSVTDISRKHSAATFSDVLFVRILYGEDFASSLGLSEARNYWQEKSSAEWRILVDELVLK